MGSDVKARKPIRFSWPASKIPDAADFDLNLMQLAACVFTEYDWIHNRRWGPEHEDILGPGIWYPWHPEPIDIWETLTSL
jgi:hypothetical protein